MKMLATDQGDAAGVLGEDVVDGGRCADEDWGEPGGRDCRGCANRG